MFNVTVSGANKNAFNGKFGLYTRGSTQASFEYLYAISRNEAPQPDDVSFFDRVESGYMSNQLQREWIWRIRDTQRRGRKPSTKVKQRYGQMFLDEFGPIVHEVREFDVKFSNSPVLHSNISVYNLTQALCPEYRYDAFGAQFILANAGRHNVVLSGDDKLTYADGSGATVSTKTFIAGNVLIKEEADKVVIKDDDAIKRAVRQN